MIIKIVKKINSRIRNKKIKKINFAVSVLITKMR